jgi:hypothetical protein
MPENSSRPALSWLVACALTAFACSTHKPAAVDDFTGIVDPDSLQIRVMLNSPKGAVTAKSTAKLAALSGKVQVTGTFDADEGVSVPADGVFVRLSEHATATCTVTGTEFACEVDSTVRVNDVAEIACNQPVEVSVTVSGTVGDTVVTGTGATWVEIDNCVPEVTIDVGNVKFNGFSTITVTVTDPRLVAAQFELTNQDGASQLPASGLTKDPADTATTWHANFDFDPDLLTSFSYLHVRVTASDQNNPPTMVDKFLGPPGATGFFGGSGFGPNNPDLFLSDLGAGRKPPTGKIYDFALATRDNAPNGFVGGFPDSDGTDDVADVVVAAEDGIYIRAGQMWRTPSGEPVDMQGNPLADGAKGGVSSLHFDTIIAEGWFIDFVGQGAGTHCKTCDPHTVEMRRVFLRDLDGDGDLDILSAGTAHTKDGDVAVAWVILNTHWTRKVLYERPDHTLAEKTMTSRAFKRVESMSGPPGSHTTAAEVADLNGDGVDDLLWAIETSGGDMDQTGLRVLLVDRNKYCAAAPCDDSVDYPALSGKFLHATQKTLNLGVTGINSIAAGDFFAGGGIDVCVGESGRPLISCYQNSAQDGTLEQAVDGFKFTDASDTSQIRAVEYTDKTGADGTDLIVATQSKKLLRWLKGDHAGGFHFAQEGEPGYRSLAGFPTTRFDVAPVGPKGEPYVLAATGGREVQEIPLDPNDNSQQTSCYRGWIMGQSAEALAVAHIDADEALDLVVADTWGVQVALGQTVAGKPNGNFVAPTTFHICAQKPDKFSHGLSPIAAVKFGHFFPGKQRQLMLVGVESLSLRDGADGGCAVAPGADPKPFPVWPIALFTNDGAAMALQPRRGEFSPYHPAAGGAAGTSDGCGSKKALTVTGNLKRAVLADLTGDGIDDLVALRGVQYPLGISNNSVGCNCVFSEQNEVANFFGDMSPPGASVNDPGKCCGNYLDADPTWTPLQGFGGGAPFGRASALVFVSSQAAPLGMSDKCAVTSPTQGDSALCTVLPQFAFAGGSNPVDVTAADVDGDHDLDVITAMDETGANCFATGQLPTQAPYLAPRVRIFENVGGAKFLPTFTTDVPGGGGALDTVKVHNCLGQSSVTDVPVSYRIMPQGLTDVLTGPWANPQSGQLDAATIFGLSTTFGQAAVLPHATGFNYTPAKAYPFGANDGKAAVGDFNEDGLQDFAVLTDTGHAIIVFTGKFTDPSHKSAGFAQEWALIVSPQVGNPPPPVVLDINVGDFNADGHQDIAMLRAAPWWKLELLLGDGIGGFMTGGGCPVAPDSEHIDVADYDGDGCDDVAVTSSMSATLFHNEGELPGDCAGSLFWPHFPVLKP